ncbi:MAG: universal stress protein [Flavobacteriales bacterium]|nr:universal stress protein [Flavobacteriales bacterium]
MSTILVPTDLGTVSQYALDMAAMVARRRGSSIRMLHAVDTLGGWTESDFSTPRMASMPPTTQEKFFPEVRKAIGKARAKLDALSAGLGKKKIEATYDIGFNLAWRSIVDFAGRLPAELIVMGSTGAGGKLFGSNAQHVVRMADCPVLTLRKAPPDKIANALILVDTAEKNPGAGLAPLLDILSSFKCKLHLLHVNTPAGFDSTYSHTDKLEAFARRLTPAFHLHVIDHFTPVEGAMAFAERDHMDLIALRTHGRTGIRAALSASVAEDLMSHGTRPVLVQRSA